MTTVTITGPGGVLPLLTPTSRCEGVGFTEWPAIFDHTPREHLWDVASGAWRGLAPTGVVEVPLALVVRGRDIAGQVAALRRVLGDGTREATVMVEDMGQARTMRLRPREIGGIDWHGQHPRRAVLASVPVRCESAHPFWALPPVHEVVTSGFVNIVLPAVGDRPVWPTITITGTHAGVRVNLTADDSAQTLPHDPDGWVIVTDPARRSVTTTKGALYPGLVPFWPEPAQPGGTVKVVPTSPGGDFTVTLDYVPEATSAWG